MEALTFTTFALVVVVLALSAIAIASPRRFLVKILAVACMIFACVIGYVGFADLLGRPKPIKLEWIHRNAPTATVLGVDITEGVGIYLMLKLPEMPEPHLYKFPWDRDFAEKLQKGLRGAERQGTKLMLKFPFEPSLDDREFPHTEFYLLPQPATPPKESQPDVNQFEQKPEQF